MSQVSPHRIPNDAGLGLKARDAGTNTMPLQTQESADCQTDVIALSHDQAHLGTLNAGELLEVTLVDLDLPGIEGMERTLFQGQRQVAGGPYSASSFVPTVLNTLIQP